MRVDNADDDSIDIFEYAQQLHTPQVGRKIEENVSTGKQIREYPEEVLVFGSQRESGGCVVDDLTRKCRSFQCADRIFKFIAKTFCDNKVLLAKSLGKVYKH